MLDKEVPVGDPTLLTREEIAAETEAINTQTNSLPLGWMAVHRGRYGRALAMAYEYLDLVERIETEAERQQYAYDRWKADGTASEATMHAAWHTAMHLRALIPQKEPTK